MEKKPKKLFFWRWRKSPVFWSRRREKFVVHVSHDTRTDTERHMLRTVATRIARRAAASASSSSPRCFAAAAQGKGDLVKDFFADSQRKFRAYAEKSKTNPLPLDGDEAKLKAYVEKNKQIMAEVRIRRLCSIFCVLIEENSIFFLS